MPPQQPDRPLDILDDGLRFRAHGKPVRNSVWDLAIAAATRNRPAKSNRRPEPAFDSLASRNDQ
jgi:hypothetical protein